MADSISEAANDVMASSVRRQAAYFRHRQHLVRSILANTTNLPTTCRLSVHIEISVYHHHHHHHHHHQVVLLAGPTARQN